MDKGRQLILWFYKVFKSFYMETTGIEVNCAC
jgi:hypothetical protein